VLPGHPHGRRQLITADGSERNGRPALLASFVGEGAEARRRHHHFERLLVGGELQVEGLFVAAERRVDPLNLEGNAIDMRPRGRSLESKSDPADVVGSGHRDTTKEKAGREALLNSFIDNTLVLGTQLSGGQRSSLDVVDVQQLRGCLWFIAPDRIKQN